VKVISLKTAHLKLKNNSLTKIISVYEKTQFTHLNNRVMYVSAFRIL
jgi:hypothetical protein